MKLIHHREKEQFAKLFKQELIDRFEDRLSILDAFLQTESHVTIDEIKQLLSQSGYNFEDEFVRETMRLICRYGFAIKNRFDNGHVRYEHRHLGQHHDHMVCTKCRQISEFENTQLEELQRQITANSGFLMLQHKMEIYGICSECLKSSESRKSLLKAKQGEQLVIDEITGGVRARMRLMAMGLRPGDVIEVINNNQQGQLVIAQNFNRLIVGRGLAEKIIVRPNVQRA